MRIPETLKFQLWNVTGDVWAIASPRGLITKVGLDFLEKVSGENWKTELEKMGVDISKYPHFSVNECTGRKLKTLLNKRFKQHLVNKNEEMRVLARPFMTFDDE